MCVHFNVPYRERYIRHQNRRITNVRTCVGIGTLSGEPFSKSQNAFFSSNIYMQLVDLLNRSLLYCSTINVLLQQS